MTGGDYKLYVANQKPVKVVCNGDAMIITRTFEDALIIENLDIVAKVEGSITSTKISDIVTQNLSFS
ncbi:hypothetical protein YERSI8AC_910003 [Enterobacterales bacterium 8AC]|nr:hypothetical protein YERSI8AC_910003 [Enterobacterales bacterium 8AC]